MTLGILVFMTQVPEWREYEKFIFEKLSEEFSDCKILFNQKVLGLFSGIDRQVDVLIRGNLGGHPILGAVECKLFKKNIDIKNVDAFVDFLEDINANLGIMITKTGYSKAARTRIFDTRIKPEIVNWDEFPEYYFNWEHCTCEPDNKWHWNLTNWAVQLDHRDVNIGQCKYCYSTNIKCKSCSEVFFFLEGTDDYETCSYDKQISLEENKQKRGRFQPRVTVVSSKQANHVQ